ncbi:helix-turn-helix transcriptional regulator [Actinoallomurus sp. NPDC052274]|uniref:helix-turn-helix domain-containing protein n=1 Tax=Actinoallomurus sp. NPDC052274 TaxID=3155420 RepID=UPI00341F75FC
MSSVRGRPKSLKAFGGTVRKLRTAAGMSQDQLAAKIPISGSHIGKIERGEGRCDRAIAERLDEILDGRGTLQNLWDDLVLDSAFPVWFDWPVVEVESVTLSAFESVVVYGLLQTESYASVLFKGNKEAVAARLRRQAVLLRDDPPPPRLTVVMLEQVLHHEIGGAEIMREQLQHLMDISAEHINVQIVPGPVPPDATEGAFVLATLQDRSELAYMENPVRGMTTEETADIQILSNRYDAIRSCALPVGASRELIRRVMEEKWA